MRVFFSSIYYLLVAGLVGVGGLLILTMIPAAGFSVKVVKSGSMEPAIHTGSIVLIHTQASYKAGDVVTFGKDTKTQIPTTHRITSIGSGPNGVYTTKGDANDVPDQENTRLGDIHGRVIVTLPYMGYILDFARKPLGFGLLVGVPAALIILEEMGKIMQEVKRMKRKKSSHELQTEPTTEKRIVD